MVSPRTVARDLELGGVQLKAGSVVDLVIGSANRDAEKFPDPDRFNIFRKLEVRPFPFATGPHVCIGQHLVGRLHIRLAHRVGRRECPPGPRVRRHSWQVPATFGVRRVQTARSRVRWSR